MNYWKTILEYSSGKLCTFQKSFQNSLLENGINKFSIQKRYPFLEVNLTEEFSLLERTFCGREWNKKNYLK